MTDEKHEDEKPEKDQFGSDKYQEYEHDKPEPVKTSDSDKPELVKHDEKPSDVTSNVVTKDEKSTPVKSPALPAPPPAHPYPASTLTPAKSYTSWALIGVAVGAIAYAVLHFVLHAF